MQYALVEGARLTAAPALRGECPHCGRPVAPKCGDVKVWHWSHIGQRHCDPWWEPETEWHREWKRRFPEEWHEVGHLATDGERHIADLKAPHGLVVEFQHSAIPDLERSARTAFYGNMVWVVDGLRRKRDWPRFQKSTHDWTKLRDKLWRLDFPEEALPKEWFGCPVPVFFDFGEQHIWRSGDPTEEEPAELWCLLPGGPRSSLNSRLIVETSVEEFVANAQLGHPLPEWADIPRQLFEAHLAQQLEAQQRQKEELKRSRQYRWARRQELRGRRMW